tara:strand:+ start:7344 stop:11888 length:4545 start_codon:yes stop_codon:yes gene_type:complete
MYDRMFELNTPKSGILKYIYHISDVHIRSGDETTSRFKEYETVFNNLHTELSKLQPIIRNEAGIVITGDTFHNKSRIESPGIKLFSMLISKLSALAPVYIILGNHDFKQDGSVNIDFLDAFLYSKPENVNYLKKTGLYFSGNVGFGLTSIKEVLEIGSGSGINKDMPDFPKPIFDENIKTKIALFHGTMNCSKLNDSRISTNGYAWDWLDVGYDIAMLGDIHKFQSFRRKSGLLAAYSGSLIQQNFGETLRMHGILEWDLEQKSFRHIEIQNPYGFMKLNLCNRPDDTHYWRCDNDDLNEIVKWAYFPKNVKVRLFGNHSQSQRLEIDKYLKNVCQDHSIDDLFVENSDKSLKLEEDMITDYTSFDTINNFISSHSVIIYKTPKIEDFLFEYTNLGNEIHNVCKKKNSDLEKDVQKYEDFLDTFKPRHLIKLSYFEWSGMLCYSGLNWFDFKLTQNRTNLLSGKNGSGKSSFLELVSIAIFGKSIPSRKTKGSLKSIIAHGKKSKVVSFTKIDIIINDKLYRIARYFDDEGKPKQRNGGLFRHDNETWVKEFSETSKLNNWVLNNLGDQDTFLMTTLLTQNNDNDILSMTSKEQREHLERMIGLTKITKEVNLYKSVLNNYKHIASFIRNSLENIKKDLDIDDNSNELFNEGKYDSKCKEDELLQYKKNFEKRNTEIQKYVSFSCPDNSGLTDQQINEKISNMSIDVSTIEDTKRKIIQNEILIASEKYRSFIGIDEECITNEIEEVKEPNISQKECNNRLEECSNWNLTKTLPIGNIEINIQDIKQLNKEYDRQIEDRKQMYPPCCRPEMSTIELECKKKKTEDELEEFENKIDSRYKSICVKPDISLEKINQIKTDIDLEIEVNGQKPEFDLYELARNTIDKNEKLFQLYLTESETTKKHMDLYEDKLKRINHDVQIISNDIIDEIQISSLDKTKIIDKLKLLKRMRKCLTLKKNLKYKIKTFLDEYNLVDCELVSTKHVIEDLNISVQIIENELVNIPYNPSCCACRQQPTRIQLDKMKNEIKNKEIEMEINVRKRDNIFSVSYERVVIIYNKLKESLDVFSEIESEEETLCQNLREFQKYEKQIDHKNALNAISACFQSCLSKSRIKYESIIDKFQKLNNTLNEDRQIIMKYKYFECNAERWTEKQSLIATYKELWDIYEKNKQYNEIKEGIILKRKLIEEIDIDIESLKQYNVYIEDCKKKDQNISNITDEINEIKGSLNAFDIFYTNEAVYSAIKVEVEDILHKWNMFDEYILYKNKKEYLNIFNENKVCADNLKLCEELLYLNSVLKNRQILKQRKRIEEEMSVLNLKIIEIEVELKVYNKIKAINQDKFNRYNELLKVNKIIDSKFEYYDKLIFILDKFREMTLSSVIPVLETYVNRLISSVNSKLKICCSVQDGGLFKFTANNGQFVIPLEKTSGFEKSMISICIRLAFVMLTLKNNSMGGELLIDEAFVNCDKTHITRIPIFLNSLLSNFESIILVSHIEYIKDSVDNTIEITNFNINYGQKKC